MPTPRQAAREANLTRIKALALEQLATDGAGDLSLRSIARDLDIVSSAIYRYYASRDDLITALIVDAYDELAATIEQSSTFDDALHQTRTWARAQPHRFALIYGSAIPGYRAPEATIAPAAAVVTAFLAHVPDDATVARRTPFTATLEAQVTAMRHQIGDRLDDQVLRQALAVFAHLIGVLTLELNGHFVGVFEPADALFDSLVVDWRASLGLS